MRYILSSMLSLFDAILALQRQLQGALAGHAVALFDSPADLASGLAIAIGIGLVHALTPGHGKAVIFSYFLGHNAGLLASLRVALVAALTHGSVAVLLVLTAGRVLSPLGRPTGAGAWLEVGAGTIVAAMGALYVVQALRPLWRPQEPGSESEVSRPEVSRPEVSRPVLAIAMGLLPCPLTIIVVGAAVNQGATGAGIALAAGISIGSALTIGCFGLLGIVLRQGGLAFAGGHLPRLLKALGWLELATSLLIFAVGAAMAASAIGRMRPL